MKLLSPLTLMVLILTPLQAAETVYKYVDADGNVHYTDAPSPEQGSAEEIKVELTPHSSSGPIIKPRKKLSSNKKQHTSEPLSVVVTSPSNDATIRANNGSVSIRGSIKPFTPRGSRLQLVLDGSEYAQPQSGSGWYLKQVNRGSHTAVIKLLGRNGKVLATSEAVTFHILRAASGG